MGTADYTNTVIYKISCNDINILECYIGHTTNLNRRVIAHKSKCNNIKCNGYNFKIYKIIRENGGWSNWSITSIEKLNCLNKKEAILRERYWFDALNSNLNSYIPANTTKEYLLTNLKLIKLKKKIYYKANVERIKEYYLANKDERNNYQKLYYETNKDKIKKSKINKE